MTPLEIILDIVKITVPSVVVFITAYMILRKQSETAIKKEVVAGRNNITNSMLPVRLQAYERLVLLLERISPNNLVMRTQNQNLTASQYHQELLVTIRSEYEHNLTQQVYVSKAAWEAVKRSKEEITKLINMAASQINPNEKSIELSKLILELSMRIDQLPTQIAADFVKEEARNFF